MEADLRVAAQQQQHHGGGGGAHHHGSADGSQQHHHNNTLTLSLPGIHSTPTSRSTKQLIGGDGGNNEKQHGREDCWSESATFTLIEAWGDRYIELNRGNLKQKHWKDVAGAVNSREDGKAQKTDVQCKNRLDTLKKKYKLEKNKVATSGGSGPTKWIFFEKLDELIGTSRKHKKAVKNLKRKRDSRVEDVNGNGNGGGEPKTFNNASTNTKSKESPDMTDSCPHATTPGTEGKPVVVKRKLQEGPFKDLARAIIKFGEVYERIESAKQQQLMELEKQRMEFTKDLELQRMQLFMQTQVELAKMKHGKHGSTEHYL